MKNSLYFIRVAISFNLIITSATLSGQTVLLSENFSGFTSGTHGTPSTSDVASTLDTKTSVPGWTGNLIYSAGGEIKIGTSSLTGWIETPALDLSANSGCFTISFDICRWPGDATTIQVYHNGTVIGDLITPADQFQNIRISGTGGTVSGKIKLMALTKRFFLDNFSVSSSLPTNVDRTKEDDRLITVFPVPVLDELTIRNIGYPTIVEIFDITGRKVISFKVTTTGDIRIPVNQLNGGLYFLRLISSHGIEVIKFTKK